MPTARNEEKNFVVEDRGRHDDRASYNPNNPDVGGNDEPPTPDDIKEGILEEKTQNVNRGEVDELMDGLSEPPATGSRGAGLPTYNEDEIYKRLDEEEGRR